MAAEDDAHPAVPGAGVPQGVQEVHFGVGGVLVDGALGPGEDDGLSGVLDEIGKGRGGVGQGVRAVAEDEAVVGAVVVLNEPGQLQPVLRPDVGGIQVQGLERVNLAQGRGVGHVGQQLLWGDAGGQALFCLPGGDGASRGDEQDLLHGCLPGWFLGTV